MVLNSVLSTETVTTLVLIQITQYSEEHLSNENPIVKHEHISAIRIRVQYTIVVCTYTDTASIVLYTDIACSRRI